MNTPAYVISLVRCPERRQWMTEQFAREGIAFEFLDAVDGRCLPAGDQAAAARGPLTPGELACARSHQEAWLRLLRSGARGAFIFEDDCEILPGFSPAILDDVEARTRPGEVVLLQDSCRDTWFWGRRRLWTWRRAIVRPLGDVMLATAYYLTREGAERLTRRPDPTRFRFPVDHWQRQGPQDDSWAKILPVRVLKPGLVMQKVDFPSEIRALGREGPDGTAFSRIMMQPRSLDWRHLPRNAIRHLRRQMRCMWHWPD